MDDGWNREELSYIEALLDQLQAINYEIKNCVRGSYTKCKTYKDLGEYIQYFAARLADEVEDLGYIDKKETEYESQEN